MVFDSNFSFSDHMSQVIKSTRVHARDLYRICPLLDLNTSVHLANASVSSRLDTANPFFFLLLLLYAYDHLIIYSMMFFNNIPFERINHHNEKF